MQFYHTRLRTRRWKELWRAQWNRSSTRCAALCWGFLGAPSRRTCLGFANFHPFETLEFLVTSFFTGLKISAEFAERLCHKQRSCSWSGGFLRLLRWMLLSLLFWAQGTEQLQRQAAAFLKEKRCLSLFPSRDFWSPSKEGTGSHPRWSTPILQSSLLAPLRLAPFAGVCGMSQRSVMEPGGATEATRFTHSSRSSERGHIGEPLEPNSDVEDTSSGSHFVKRLSSADGWKGEQDLLRIFGFMMFFNVVLILAKEKQKTWVAVDFPLTASQTSRTLLKYWPWASRTVMEILLEPKTRGFRLHDL